MVFLAQILADQYEAALCMLDCALRASKHDTSNTLWESPMALYTPKQLVYHTLFFTDYYLTPGGEPAFTFRSIHKDGGNELSDDPAPGLPLEGTAAYLQLVRTYANEVFAAETDTTLAAPANHARRTFTRAELHLYSLRHLQHHTGALHAHYRRVLADKPEAIAEIKWVGQGWK